MTLFLGSFKLSHPIQNVIHICSKDVKIQSLLKHILLNYIGQLTIGVNMQANCKTPLKRYQTNIRRNFLVAQLSLL